MVFHLFILNNILNGTKHLFPDFIVNDNRDGRITHRVYVPADTEFKILDTNKLGDQKILLRVTDDWGHVTEVVFIFRVVAKIPKK